MGEAVGIWRRTWVRIGVAVFGALVGIAMLAGTASAETISVSMQHDLETLKTQLSGDSEFLSSSTHFSGASTTVQHESERALAEIKALQERFDHTTLDGASEWPGANTVAGSEINADATALNDGLTALPDSGSTVGAIGGEASDLAGGLSLAAPLALLPIAGALAYEDITTGTNKVTVALFGGTEDHEALEKAASNATATDTAAESLAWVEYPALSGCASQFNNCIEKVEYEYAHCPGKPPPYHYNEGCGPAEAISRFGDSLEDHPGTGYHLESELPKSPLTHRMYFLEPKIGGVYYVGTNAGQLHESTTAAGITSTNTELKGWHTPERLGEESNWGRWTCDEAGFLWHYGVEGLPSELGPQILYGKLSGEGCEPEFNHGATLTVRSPSREHKGLPKSVNTVELEAFEAGGHPIIHSTGHPVGSEGGLSLLAAIEAALRLSEEGGERRLEEAEKHWLEEVGGGTAETNLPGTAAVPSCSGTGSECKAALEAAGFTNVHLHTVGYTEAVLSAGKSGVTSVSPAATTVIETSAEVTINQNPPDPERITELATNLAAKNETGTEKESELLVISRYCLEYVTRAGLAESLCESLPIFASGSDVATATEHDIEAIAPITGHPEWVQLNYSSVKEKEEEDEVKRYWYKKVGECGEKEAPSGDSCDEYPFFATAQGGPLAEPPVSLKYIKYSDNTEQGGKYGAFVKVCGMAARGATEYRFLATPIPPSLGVPTWRLCN